MGSIEAYVENLKIKRAFVGGFDKESVFEALQEISSMYQKEMSRLTSEKGTLETDKRKAALELDQASKELHRISYELEEERKSHNEFQTKLNALTMAIDAVNFSKERIIEEARSSAEKLMADAQEKYDNIKEAYLRQKEQKDSEFMQMLQMKQQFGVTMDQLRSGLIEMLSELDTLKKDNLEQASILEEEAEMMKNNGTLILLNDEMGRVGHTKTEYISQYDN